jgi:hypothetical protein
MRIAIAVVLMLPTIVGVATAADNRKDDYLLRDYMLMSAKSETEIATWAKGKTEWANIARFDRFRIERFDIDGKKLLVLVASLPTGGYSMVVFVYTGSEKEGWGLVAVRHAGTRDVKIEADLQAKLLRIRSFGDKLLLVLPVENLEIITFKQDD